MMERLTTNKDVSEMGMYELAHNGCYIKDGEARYRDSEMDMSARNFARNLMTTLRGEDLPVDDDEFDEEILENLQYDPFADTTGLIALFYRNLWAMAELRENLKEYEDAEEQGLLLRLPCKVGDTVYAFLASYNHFSECQIDKIEIKPTIYGNMCYFIEPTGRRGCLYKYFEDDFGRTVFLTKEEAEQKLKEMEGGNNGSME